MQRARIEAVVIKDWKELLRNPQAVVPVLVLPIILALALPIMVIALGSGPMVSASLNGIATFVERLPQDAIPRDLPVNSKVVYVLLVYFVAPILLLIPVVSAMVTASNSFAGERERRTLEGLLFSPLTAREFLVSKIIVSFVPSLVLTWVSFALYIGAVDVAGASLLRGAVLPTPAWGVLILLLAPALSFFVVGLVVAASERARTVQAAQSMAAFVVLPIVAIMVTQATGAALFNTVLAFVAFIVIIIVDIVVFAVLVRRFDREALVLGV